MDYTPTTKKRCTFKSQKNILEKTYPLDLQLYTVPPTGQILLMEFQDLALERQKVLQLLELTLAQQHKSIDQIKMAFINSLRKEGYHTYVKLLNGQGDSESRRKDHISHFVLRLAYSLKDDLQNYILIHETELFKLRFHALSRENLSQFLSTSGIHYSPVSQEFKKQNRENLCSSTTKEVDFENTDFYELPFDKVVDLVSDRKVYLHKGIAYVPQSDLITVFLAHFRSNLSIELNKARKFVLNNLDDERLQSFLKSLPECFKGMAKVVWNSENVPIAKLNDLSRTSYPLCMKVMHDHLVKNHHLKNTGRLQYGLFLKGIGVTLEDSIEFWKSEMTQKEDINEDKFNKQYLYQIRYNYGKVGRRVNYRPLGCNKLITEPVGPGEVHGCPYKNMDTNELTKRLLECHLSHSDVGEITKLSSEGHYTLACTRYFDSMHKQPPGRMFLHPNHYFQESRLILTKDEMKEENAMQEAYVPFSPEAVPQPIKVKVDNNLNTSNSITPSKSIEKKVRTLEKKHRIDPKNIEALLNDSD